MDIDISVIRSVPLFVGIDAATTEALVRAMRFQRLGRGEILFREGEEGNRFYLVLTGKVKLGRGSADGRENLIAVLGPGEMIGELTLFDPGPRTATATAVSKTELAGLAHSELVAWVERYPQVAKHLLAALARRLRRTNDSLTDLVFSDVPGRVARILLDLAQRFGEARDGAIHVPHGLTQEELAQLAGASRETVNKALADFAARGWITVVSRGVDLLDVDRLDRRSR